MIALSFSFIFWWWRWHVCNSFISFNIWHVQAKIYEDRRKSNIKLEEFQRLREIYMVGLTTTFPCHTNVGKIFGTLWSSILTHFRHYIALKWCKVSNVKVLFWLFPGCWLIDPDVKSWKKDISKGLLFEFTSYYRLNWFIFESVCLNFFRT